MGLRDTATDMATETNNKDLLQVPDNNVEGSSSDDGDDDESEELAEEE